MAPLRSTRWAAAWGFVGAIIAVLTNRLLDDHIESVLVRAVICAVVGAVAALLLSFVRDRLRGQRAG